MRDSFHKHTSRYTPVARVPGDRADLRIRVTHGVKHSLWTVRNLKATKFNFNLDASLYERDEYLHIFRFALAVNSVDEPLDAITTMPMYLCMYLMTTTGASTINITYEDNIVRIERLESACR